MQSELEQEVIFSDAAANKVRALLDDEDDSSQKLRVFVTGGGCSGFQYGFKFDNDTAEDDTVVVKMGELTTEKAKDKFMEMKNHGFIIVAHYTTTLERCSDR